MIVKDLCKKKKKDKIYYFNVNISKACYIGTGQVSLIRASLQLVEMRGWREGIVKVEQQHMETSLPDKITNRIVNAVTLSREDR